jgi:acetyl-CoA C-acetyltransferase
VVVGHELKMNMQEEIDRGIWQPVQLYPMFETAIRAAAGTSPDDHLVRISELWARFSAVAADNPHAWNRRAHSAAEIRTPGPSNRMIGLPYPKLMNSNNDVDMAAALIVCSAEAAERLGVAPDRWVFPHAGTDCHEHAFVSNRDTFARTPAIERGGAMVLDLAGLGIDDIGLIDLYSCFPAAVQLGARSLGLDPYDASRQLTRTGGLTFAGGPWNNYVMHAIATVVGELRGRPGEHALVWANGGYATKHAFGVYSTEPPSGGFRHGSPQDEIDALPRRELASPVAAAGSATVEAYTVMHSREGDPERGLAACLLADGRRAWGTSEDASTVAALCAGEWVGRPVTLDVEGTLHLD